MRTETAGVTETLIESAKKEFLEHGFQNANLRRISSESGVSTGSIYTRFGDKAGLFSAVVKPAADGLMELYLESITAARESGDPAEATSQGNEGTELVLKYIYENFLDSKRLQQAIVLFSNAQVGFTLETKDELFQSGYAREYMERRQIKDTQANPELARFFEKRNQAFKPITEYNPGKDKVTKIVFIAYDKYALLDTVPHLSKDFNVVLFSKPEDEFINGEIISKNCTKADAIERVIDYYHASMEDTIAFGDSMNDYQMIEKVNKGIVFEGAKEKLLDISYDTFIDPDQDGIALSLEKLGLIKKG